ncbi:hypothetical protein ABI59_09655 [Acidobacteria bacterium Mor1]|nr:hypothetical protein ABI59_09655 [Acidobacteria bacterium Mor1]
MKVRCVIVDDERLARERIKRLLKKHDDFELIGEAENVAEAVKLLESSRPDLCFLDVQMPGGEGFDVLEQLDDLPHVIFTTAFDQYAVRAFEYRSLDYLLKPFSRSRFAEALERARKTLSESKQEKSNDPAAAAGLLDALDQIRKDLTREARSDSGPPVRVTGKRGNKIVLLDPDEVLWIEAEDALIFAHTAEGRFLVEKTLAELETELGDRFFRSHRCYLVNLARIGEILPAEAGTYRILLRTEHGDEIPLSRRQARRLRELFPW